MEPWQQRVEDEAVELAGRVGRLAEFIEGPTFLTLPSDEQGRLMRQAAFMRDYLGVLKERMEAWSKGESNG